MSLKTPFTNEIQEYQKHVQRAQAEVDAGNYQMTQFLVAYSCHLNILIDKEDDWLKTGPCLIKKNS